MSKSDTRGVLAGLGITAALVVCCALPLLLAAGALGALAGFFSSPWLWAAAGVAVVIALALTAARKRSHPSHTGEDSPRGGGCCPPPRGDRRAERPAHHQSTRDNSPRRLSE